MSIEVMKQALEALTGNWVNDEERDAFHQKQMASIAALREAIKKADQAQPVAWRLWDEDPLGGTDHRWVYYDESNFAKGVDPTKYFKIEPLYTAPPPRKAEQDDRCEECGMKYCECGEQK